MTLRFSSLFAFVLLAASWLAPCGAVPCKAFAEAQGPLGVQGLSTSEVKAIRQTILSWTDALVKRDIADWDSYWAKDSVLMPPGHALVTGDAKLNALAKTPPYDDVEKATFSDWAIVGRGDLAVVSNDIEIEPKTGGAPTAARQLIVLRRHESGKWLIQAVMFNSSATSAETR